MVKYKFCLVGSSTNAKKFEKSIERYGRLCDLKELFKQCIDSHIYRELYIFDIEKRRSVLSWVQL